MKHKFKKLKKMFKDKKTLILTLLIVALAGISVGYSAISTYLNIQGYAVVDIPYWSVIFDNLDEAVLTGKAYEEVAPVITDNKTQIGTYNVIFNEPGDSVLYSFDVVNEGDLNAYLSLINVSEPACVGAGDNASADAEYVCSHLNYSLTYEDGTELEINDTLNSGTSKRLKLTLSYDDPASAGVLPMDDVNISNLDVTLVYSQGEVSQKETYKFTVNPDPIDSNVIIRVADMVIKEGVGKQTINLATGLTANYTVSKAGYASFDGTYTMSNSNYTANVKIDEKIVGSFVCNDKTYNGQEQTACTCTGGTMGDNYKGTTPGTYTATCEADSSHTIPNTTLTWTMDKANGSISCSDTSYTYDGNSHGPTCSCGFGTLGGDLSKINAGNYAATCTEDEYHKAASASWNIEKAPGSVSCNPTELFITDVDGENAVTITNPTGGTLSAKAKAKSVTVINLDLTFNGNVLRIVPSHLGTGGTEKFDVTVTSAATTNYKESSCVVAVTVDKKSCVTGDTLVTLADGTSKRIDELTYDDELLVWDFFEGKYTTAKALIIMKHDDVSEKLELTFDDGRIINIVGSHLLFDLTENRFVDINKYNVDNYINHDFVVLDGDYNIFNDRNPKSVKLKSYDVVTGKVSSWSAETYKHINLILNGMLTFTPQQYDGLYEYFDYGPGLKYTNVDRDIKKYGLYEASDFENIGLPSDVFDAVGGQYFKIFVGKGILTYDDIVNLIGNFVNQDTQVDYIVNREKKDNR